MQFYHDEEGLDDGKVLEVGLTAVYCFHLNALKPKRLFLRQGFFTGVFVPQWL